MPQATFIPLISGGIIYKELYLPKCYTGKQRTKWKKSLLFPTQMCLQSCNYRGICFA